MTREAWAKTVHQMIGYGATIPEDKVAPIVDYLATHYGEPAPPTR